MEWNDLVEKWLKFIRICWESVEMYIPVNILPFFIFASDFIVVYTAQSIFNKQRVN